MTVTPTPTPVIIDTDPGVDDIIAILFAIASPEIEIIAFNVSYGNTDLEASYLNVFKAYKAIQLHLELNPDDKDRFPNFNSGRKPLLLKGSSGPLEGELVSAKWFHGRDGLGDITTRHPELSLDAQESSHPFLTLSTQNGVDAALDILLSRPPRSVTYIALGPLTNLARMMRKDSQLVRERIGRVISMGGALDVPGNTNPVAEFNYFADPYAVKELLLSTTLHEGLPLDRFIMLPLDITTPHELTFPFYEEAVDNAFLNTSLPSVPSEKPPITHFTSSILEKVRETMLEFNKDAMELHDIVAVWCALVHPPFADNESATMAPGWEGMGRVFEIERIGELTRGMLVTDRREEPSAYPEGAIRSEAQRDPNDPHVHEIPQQKAYTSNDPSRTSGVFCVTKTPGPRVLLRTLLKRVWNADFP